MNFTFAARAILELGRELISSDQVALYELIKNAVDAGSPQIEIVAEIQLLHSQFREAIAYLEDSGQPRDAAKRLRSLLRDPDLPAAAELLTDLQKNGTSKARFVDRLQRFYIEANYIEVRDNGHGMGLNELATVFLRIGTNARRKENRQGARHLGDKGIGRLSTMRLGDRLEVETSKTGDSHWNNLEIDWSWFDSEDDADVDDYDIRPEPGARKKTRKDHGTTIRISALHADWDLPRFTDLLQGKIARMIDPFEPGAANRLIVARHNGQRVRVPSIPRELLDSAHAVCHVEFKIDNDEPTLRGEIDYRLRHRKRQVDLSGSDLLSVTQKTSKRRAKRGHAAFKLVPLPLPVLKQLEGFKCDIYWYNRRVVDAVTGLTQKASETRQRIANWSGGPMLYRYGFRVLPFGEPGDDWLALDKRAFGVSGFKLNRQQVIGRVRINTPHDILSEQTNREGLIDSDASHALQTMLKYLVHVEFRNLINDADKAEKEANRLANVDNQILLKTHARVRASLERIRRQYSIIPDEEIDDLCGSVEKLTEIAQGFFDRIEETRRQADEDRGQFVYLSGIGLMTEFIFHELDRAMSYTIKYVSDANQRTKPSTILKDQLVTLQKRIAAFDEMTAEKRQSKSTFDLSRLTDQVLDAHRNEFSRHGIEVDYSTPSRPLNIKAVRGMTIQILENLVVNSSYWLKRQKNYEPGFQPRLSIVVDSKRMQLNR